MSGTATQKRRFWNFRLSTLVAAAIGVGGLMYLNMSCCPAWELDARLETRSEWNEDGSIIRHFVTVHYFQNHYGFPLPALKQSLQPFLYGDFASIQSHIRSELEWGAAIFDGGTALFVLYVVVRISEMLARRKAR